MIRGAGDVQDCGNANKLIANGSTLLKNGNNAAAADNYKKAAALFHLAGALADEADALKEAADAINRVTNSGRVVNSFADALLRHCSNGRMCATGESCSEWSNSGNALNTECVPTSGTQTLCSMRASYYNPSEGQNKALMRFVNCIA